MNWMRVSRVHGAVSISLAPCVGLITFRYDREVRRRIYLICILRNLEILLVEPPSSEVVFFFLYDFHF